MINQVTSRNLLKNGIRDTIVMWLTLHGFKAYPTADKGSSFIHSLCKAIKQNAKTKKIAEIIRIVQAKVDKYT
ncbi:hypothetical protein B4U80_14401 [Leptotrombidium deliense]|uniref:Caspase family p10 domain-containing protein n=1 Tax=Leptotrombidium deliense TaxID=299467 RepID=A0A443RW56_9ACAR|nr:hypothetical protein B4U80_14401 [Leptotrombidium deliense]